MSDFVFNAQTLRDVFAGQAMQAFLESDKYLELVDFRSIAENAYALADAMLEAKARREEGMRGLPRYKCGINL